MDNDNDDAYAVALGYYKGIAQQSKDVDRAGRLAKLAADISGGIIKMIDETILTTEQAAEMLGMSERTLENWRWKREGPSYIKLGRSIRYRKTDVENWIKANIVRL